MLIVVVPEVLSIAIVAVVFRPAQKIGGPVLAAAGAVLVAPARAGRVEETVEEAVRTITDFHTVDFRVSMLSKAVERVLIAEFQGIRTSGTGHISLRDLRGVAAAGRHLKDLVIHVLYCFSYLQAAASAGQAALGSPARAQPSDLMLRRGRVRGRRRGE